MNYLFVGTAFLIIFSAAAGLFLWFSPTEPSAQPQGVVVPNAPNTTVPVSQTDEQMGQAVRREFVRVVAANNPDNIKPSSTVIFQGWALQLWSGDITGGEALFKYDSAKNLWSMVDIGGGSWGVDSLVRIGIPQVVAEGLIAKRGY